MATIGAAQIPTATISARKKGVDGLGDPFAHLRERFGLDKKIGRAEL